jgi:ssRNA-specific RNase YbeY (16S rRNA maturation enzyme)
MNVRYKKHPEELIPCSRFNISTLGEVILPNTSEFVSELDVWLEQKKEWKDMHQAFMDKDLITNNMNTSFFEPPTEEDRKRGFTNDY